jgi:DNA-directed RNA polymerase subunit M/transcription elongation factor TFIIS
MTIRLKCTKCGSMMIEKEIYHTVERILWQCPLCDNEIWTDKTGNRDIVQCSNLVKKIGRR